MKIHDVVKISVDEIAEHPSNSNRQDPHMFKELKKSIQEHGFDENLLVTKRDDGNEGYWVVSGNHRFRAAVALGYEELPCVVHEDWDAATQEIELVRRNYVRGQISRELFTEAVNRLSKENAMPLDEIMEKMGFADVNAFSAFYAEEKKREKAMASSVASNNGNANSVKMLDDISIIVSAMVEKYGKSMTESFLVYPLGGRQHCYVNINASIKQSLDAIALYCVTHNTNINTVLGGVLAIGLHHTELFKKQTVPEEVIEAGSVEGDSNPKLIE